MKQILLDAAAFCYGPISTLLSIVDQLPARGLDLVLMVSGTSEEYARSHGGPYRIVSCDTADPEDLRRNIGLFESSALFVSNTNPTSASFALELGCRVVYIDTLFWMWDEIDARLAEKADAFIVQDFTGVEANHRRLGMPISHYHLVGPLIDVPEVGCARDDLCLVGMGGMESHISIPGKDNRYAWVLAPLILEALIRTNPTSRVLFCGRGHVMQSLAASLPESGAEFGFLPHRDYVGALSRCRLHLLSPGLTGAFEARSVGAPTCLLLGQNYSQQLQAETFLEDPGWPFAGVHWGDVYDDWQIDRFLPEPEAVACINELIVRFEHDARAQARYTELLTAALARVPPRPELSLRSSGVNRAAEIILDLLQ